MPNKEITTTTVNPFGAVAPASETLPASAQTDSQRAVAEVQAALVIARMNPRDERKAMDRILNACCRPTLARSAVYAYARGGTSVSGPSIRLAEAIAQNWGNIQYGIRELSSAGGKSEVQAYAWDVETNTRREVTFSVPHVRATKRGSYKLEDPRDIYELVANQGARRLRACILSVIPGDVVETAVDQCSATISNETDVSPEGVKKLLDTFAKLGVTQAQIEKFIQCRAEAIKPAQVVRLRQIYSSLKDGMSNVSDWFESETKPVPAAPEKLSLKDKIRARQAAEEVAEAVAPETPEAPREEQIDALFEGDDEEAGK